LVTSSSAKDQVVFYCEADGTAPVLEWFGGLSTTAPDKCRIRIQRLADLGHELRRPDADLLRNGIHELRIGLRRVNYRILYFFHGRVGAVLAHAVAKEDRVPDQAIDTALKRKREYESDPRLHTLEQS
jgi:phage-related protein